jgi:hypothetical protein
VSQFIAPSPFDPELDPEHPLIGGARCGPGMREALFLEKRNAASVGGRAGVEIDTRTVEELRRLKDPLGQQPRWKLA